MLGLVLSSIEFPRLGIRFGRLPEGIELFGGYVSFYGILLACAMLSGFLLVEYLAKKSGQKPELYLDLALVAILAGLVGARIGYVLSHLGEFSENPMDVFSLRQGGLSFYGALLFGSAVAFLYCKKKKYPFLRIADTSVMGVLLGQFLGRFGDFLNRDMPGTSSDGLFSMRMEVTERMAASRALAEHAIVAQDGIYVQVHPVVFYEMIFDLLLFVLLLFLFFHRRFDGEVFGLYLTGYGLVRFVLEFFRADTVPLFASAVTAGQIFSAAAVFCGVWCCLVQGKKRKNGREKQ